MYSCGSGILYDIYSFEFYSPGLARLGQGIAMKSRTDNECVLDSVLIGPQFICHVFPFKFIAM